VTTALVTAAFALSRRRDVGRALVPPRPGASDASRALSRPLGLALRLQRANLAGWGAGLLVFDLVFGTILIDIERFYEESGFVRDVIAGAPGSDALDAFLATIVALLALTCSANAITAALRARDEESAGRAEPLLAAPLSRVRWLMSHLVIALAGSAVLLMVAILGFAGSGAAVLGQADLLPRLFGAALAQLPALWLVVGVAAALMGLWPRAAAVVWVLPLYALIDLLYGRLLSLPAWTSNLSPFAHVPRLPGASSRSHRWPCWLPARSLLSASGSACSATATCRRLPRRLTTLSAATSPVLTPDDLTFATRGCVLVTTTRTTPADGTGAHPPRAALSGRNRRRSPLSLSSREPGRLLCASCALRHSRS